MQIACHLDSTFNQHQFAVRGCLVSLSGLSEMSLIVNRKLYTAIDNLLCTKNAGQFGIYQQISNANQVPQIGLDWLCLFADRSLASTRIFFSLLNISFSFILFNMKPLSIECMHFSCIINCLQLLCLNTQRQVSLSWLHFRDYFGCYTR